MDLSRVQKPYHFSFLHCSQRTLKAIVVTCVIKLELKSRHEPGQLQLTAKIV